MIVELKLFPYNSLATDGSIIPESVVDEYLSSERCKLHLLNKAAFGGSTHKDRKKDNRGKDIGEDDLILINKNTVGSITKFFKQDGWVMAHFEFLNPQFFSGQVKEDISYYVGLTLSGSLLPVSVVLDAMWTAAEECRLINEVCGLDFTLNPAFKGAQVVKIIRREFNK